MLSQRLGGGSSQSRVREKGPELGLRGQKRVTAQPCETPAETDRVPSELWERRGDSQQGPKDHSQIRTGASPVQGIHADSMI